MSEATPAVSQPECLVKSLSQHIMETNLGFERIFRRDSFFFFFLLNLHQKPELLKSTFLVLLYLIPFAFIQVLFSVLYVKVFIPSSSLLFLNASSTIQNDMTNIFHMLLFHPLPREESRLQCCVFVRLLLLVLFFFKSIYMLL